MKEHPILFSAPMVRALLDGSKTQTRRIVKVPSISYAAAHLITVAGGVPRVPFYDAFTEPPTHDWMVIKCPYGQPGDRLWVRESFWGCDLPGYGDQPCVVYDDEWIGKEYRPAEPRPWGRKFGRIPSIHMPRNCSRILLEVVSVRVERLNDCSMADALAEGVTPIEDDPAYYCVDGKHLGLDPRESYAELWESINGAGSWEVNPWVWVVEFKRITP